MSHESDFFKNIALNETLYAKHICENTAQRITEGEKVPILSIPRTSFTAFRLSYASPVEISQSSRSVLLGGVPNLWYLQHKSNFLRSLYRLAHKKVSRRVQLAGQYANGVSYHSRRRSRRPKSSFALHDGSIKRQDKPKPKSKAAPLESNVDPSIGKGEIRFVAQLRSSSPRSSSPVSSDTNSVAVADLSQEGGHGLSIANNDNSKLSAPKCSATKCRGSLLRIDPSVHPVPDSAPENLNGNHQNRSPVSQANNSGDRNDLKASGLKRPCIDATKTNKKLASFQYSMQSEEYYSAEDGFTSSSSEYEDTLSDSTPETIKSEIIHHPQSSRTAVPVLIQPLSEKRSASNVKFRDEERPVRQRQESSANLRAPSDDSQASDTQASGLSYSFDEDEYHTRRNGSKSGQVEYLRLVSPEPNKLTPQESTNISKLDERRKVLKDVKSFVSETGRKIHFDKLDKFHFDLSRVLGADHTISQKFFKKFSAGEVVKMEKMLVFVKSSKSARGPPLHFSDVEPIDTRVVERWKEFIVVARATGVPEAPLYLQFYRNRNIPHVEAYNSSVENYRANSMDFMFDSSCIVGFYNTLDKTIHVITTAPSKVDAGKMHADRFSQITGRLKIYILRCSSSASAEKWLLFLRRSLGIVDRSTKVHINIPEVKVSLEIPLPLDLLRVFDKQSYLEEDNLKLLMMPRGYKPVSFPLARYLELVILNKLGECGYKNAISGLIQANTISGFCWKHYDRIEWCPGDQYDLALSGVSLKESHLLEYRSLTHYPRSVILKNGETWTEPSGVEGFLMKCTNRYGKETEKVLHTAYYRFLYFFTSDGLLFFMSSFKGLPPLPDGVLSKDESCAYDIGKLEDKIKNLPESFEHNPYPLDLDSHIEWLKEDTSSADFQEKDNAAFAAMWRKIAHVIKAEKVIDLTEVIGVSKLSAANENSTELRYRFLTGANNFVWKATQSVEETIESMFVLSMSNGLKVKLLAPSPQVADEWVTRLEYLSRYWKHRKSEDTKSMWSAKMENLSNLKIPESEESNISEDTPKWVTDRGVANENVYNISAQAMLRPLMQSGILYEKPHKHSSFKKFFVILTPGFIILYKYFKSAKVNYSKKVVDHRHYMTIPIEECYVYSGNLTSLDLLQRDKQFDNLNPGHNPLPRVYPDGWRSSEDEASKCFTLWFGTKRAVSNYNSLFNYNPKSRTHTASSVNGTDEVQSGAESDMPNTRSSEAGDLNMEGNPQKNKNFLRAVSRLGVSGRSLVFMARSRQERDQWALKIQCELERLKGSTTAS
ncbi:LANO_0C05952g1_1 [Lachancea nothofagi CBS 11611]|uniref:LANO_0C05952g1_1 n=1 Tax=Lachancea nothofagi CBS 11611 TaxID=1266666 RepID=A0A1G4J7Q0_9SACH|nr:LANO_0C05952g1_1 [Lachancea nothofagi CBS 11611]